MASWQELALPQFKGAPGWEFTALDKNFDLASFATAGDGDLAAADRAELVFDLPAEAVRMTQVDDAFARVEEADERGPAGHAAVAGGRDPRRARRHAGSARSSTPARTSSRARNAAEWAGGAFVYVPAGVKVEAPIVLSAIQAPRPARR